MPHTKSFDVSEGYADIAELDLDVTVTESDVTADFDRKAGSGPWWSGGGVIGRCPVC
ncbi:hypothetical protein [Streptomyces huiliensis]|uniref:hypothetical protein n=1 Tax=Streptomyces huiliensis TaxID=2876027 RepID=UPI001CC1007C|nr:hypothetical protein [Streptomyces huiliensis]MBZ4323280.1 hypothetical protein [Streptomyces huiliensis]